MHISFIKHPSPFKTQALFEIYTLLMAESSSNDTDGATNGLPLSDDSQGDIGIESSVFCKTKQERLEFHHLMCTINKYEEYSKNANQHDYDYAALLSRAFQDRDAERLPDLELPSDGTEDDRIGYCPQCSQKFELPSNKPPKSHDEERSKSIKRELDDYDDDHHNDDEERPSDSESTSDDTDEDSEPKFCPYCLQKLDHSSDDDDINKRIFDELYGPEIIDDSDFNMETLTKEMLKNLDDLTQLTWKHESTGSHYSGVKVVLSNEFDYDYMLYPTQVQCTIQPSQEYPCHSHLFVTNKDDLPVQFQEILGPNDELLPSRYREYLFPLFDEIINGDPRIRHIRSEGISPAYTIIVNREVDIDWVPSLRVQELPPSYTNWTTRKLTEEEKNNCPLYVVPKEIAASKEELWRISFSTIERKIFREKANKCERYIVKEMKRLFKLMKKDTIKEKTSWALCSYHLLIHWMRFFEDNPAPPDGEDEEFLLRKELYTLAAIESLIKALESKVIDHFFIPGFNLLQNVDELEYELLIKRLNKERGIVQGCIEELRKRGHCLKIPKS